MHQSRRTPFGDPVTGLAHQRRMPHGALNPTAPANGVLVSWIPGLSAFQYGGKR